MIQPQASATAPCSVRYIKLWFSRPKCAFTGAHAALGRGPCGDMFTATVEIAVRALARMQDGDLGTCKAKLLDLSSERLGFFNFMFDSMPNCILSPGSLPRNLIVMPWILKVGIWGSLTARNT
jgi:hypothetical protein